MAVVTKEFLSLSLFLFIRKKTMPIMGLVSGQFLILTLNGMN